MYLRIYGLDNATKIQFLYSNIIPQACSTCHGMTMREEIISRIPHLFHYRGKCNHFEEEAGLQLRTQGFVNEKEEQLISF